MNLIPRRVLVGVAALWALTHIAFLDWFIYHDSWEHNFPMLYSFTRQGGCGGLPSWLWSPDTGTPTIIYIISTSMLQILRVPALYMLGCLHFDIAAGAYFYKAGVYLSYFGLALGMYVFGRVALERHLSAAYLFAATLFAGLCLDAAHSDQVATITFWLPWTAACGVLYHRHYALPVGSRYLNFAVLFICLQAFDQYPHFQAVVVGAAAVIYAALERQRAFAALRLHWRRLWPSALTIALTISHFFILRAAIGDYVPSLRTALVVDPARFSESGFVQPTALIGSVLPGSFLAGFDGLRAGMGTLLAYLGAPPDTDWSVFRLDALAFYVGIVPLVLAAVFLLRPGMARLRLGWAIWLLVIFAVSLQQSQLHVLLLRHIPFFDLFRSYFLFILFVVLGILMISAYGFDAVLTLPDETRRVVLLRAGLGVLVLVAGAIVALVSLAGFGARPLRLLSSLEAPLVADLLAVAVAYAAVAYAAWPKVAAERRALALIAVMVLSQAAYTARAYAQVGVKESWLFAQWGLDRSDLRPLDPAVRSDPNAIQRSLCAIFAECYLSHRPMVSLRRDLDGTFLRSRQSPAFVPHLSLPVVEALSGLTMPVFWTSRHLAALESDGTLVEELNRHDSDIAHYLRDVTYVREDAIGRFTAERGTDDVWAAAVELRKVQWGRNSVRLSYQAEKPALLNASITCTSHWIATVEGRQVPLACADLGGLLIRLPAGSGTVELRYRDPWSDFVFYTRYMLLAIALFGMALVVRAGVREAREGKPHRSPPGLSGSLENAQHPQPFGRGLGGAADCVDIARQKPENFRAFKAVSPRR